jgi:DNA-binding transcriptional MerR regulator
MYMASVNLPIIDTQIPPDGLSIGAVAELTGLSIDTLRYYERAGLLLDPAPRDTGGRRRYGQRDLDWIGGLIMLRETGMSIADVRRIVVLEEHREHVLAELDRTRAHLAALERKIAGNRDAIARPATAPVPTMKKDETP